MKVNGSSTTSAFRHVTCQCSMSYENIYNGDAIFKEMQMETTDTEVA